MSSDTVSRPCVVLPSISTSRWTDSQSDPEDLLLPTRMAFDSEVNLLNRADAPPFPYSPEPADDCDRKWVEDSCRHTNVVVLLSALLFITFATFFSHFYLSSQSNPHEILTFYHRRVRKFFGGSSAGVTTTSIALAATSFSKPLVTCAVVSTCVLWLASLTVGLGCVVVSTLLRQWIPRYALVDRPPYGFRSPGAVSIFIMQHGSLRNIETILRILREWLLVAVFLFLWGLDIQLLHTANSPSPVVVLGLSFTFFLGLCLILAAWPRFTSSAVVTPV